MYLYKYLDQKGSAAILAVKRSASVAPEVNLRNSLHAGDEACSGQTSPEVQHRLSVAAHKGLMSSRNILKKIQYNFDFFPTHLFAVAFVFYSLKAGPFHVFLLLTKENCHTKGTSFEEILIIKENRV